MSQEVEKYRCTANSLNVRDAPTTASTIPGKLPKGDVIEKIDESDENNALLGYRIPK